MYSANLKWLFSSQVLAMGADVILTLALGVWIQQLTGSPSQAGAVFLFFALPSLVAPLAGPLIDKFPRRSVLIDTNIALSVFVLLLLLVGTAKDIGLIYFVAFVYGTGAQVTFAARAAIIPAVAPSTRLEQVNGLLESIRQGIRVVGPLFGTAILVAWGSEALAVSVSLTLIISAVLMLPVATDTAHLAASSTSSSTSLLNSAWVSLHDGIMSVWKITPVRQLTGVYALTFAAAGVLEVSIFSYVTEGLERPVAFVATLTTLQGLGSIIGGIAVGRLSKRFGIAKTQVCALLLLTAAVVCLVLSTNTVVASFAFVLLGAGLVAFLVSYVTLVQVVTDANNRGTVFLAVEAIGNLPFIICIGGSSVLLSIMSYRVLLGAATAALIIASGLVARSVVGTTRTGLATTPKVDSKEAVETR